MKRSFVLIAGAVALIALVALLMTQISGTRIAQASESACCSGVEAQMVADKQSDNCMTTTAVVAAQECPGIQAVAKEAGCPAFTQESTETFVVSSDKPSSCCEGSETAAMLAEACCGSCS